MYQRGVDATLTREKLGDLASFSASISEDPDVFSLEIEK